MSKTNNKIDELRSKIMNKIQDKVDDKVDDKETTKVEATEYIIYDVIPDPNLKGRNYVIVKITYNIVNKEAIVEGVKPFPDKTVGLSIQMNKENLEFWYNPSNKEKK